MRPTTYYDIIAEKIEAGKLNSRSKPVWCAICNKSYTLGPDGKLPAHKCKGSGTALYNLIKRK